MKLHNKHLSMEKFILKTTKLHSKLSDEDKQRAVIIGSNEEALHNSIRWWNKPQKYYMEFNKDSAYMTKDMFERIIDIDMMKMVDESRHNVPHFGFSFIPIGPQFSQSYYDGDDTISIKIGMDSGRLIISNQKIDSANSIDITLPKGNNKAYLNHETYKNILEYFEYSIYGIWVFMIDGMGGFFVGNKIDV